MNTAGESAGSADGRIVDLEPRHLPDLERLVADSGWNQTADDWRHMLSTGAGFGVAAPGREEIVASAVALPYGERIAWIAMVLVRSDRRRRGFASALMSRAMAWCAGRDLVAWLDATPAGAAVYGGLGFRPGWGFARWRATAAVPVGGSEARVRAPTDADLDAAVTWESEACGVMRRALLDDLARRGGTAAGAVDNGLVLGREGRTAFHLGPIIADDAETATALLDAAITPLAGAPVIVDATAGTGLEAALAARGFVRERPFTRMALGRDPGERSPARLFAVAGPEYG